MLFSHGNNRQKGVCILLNPSACNLSIESQFCDVDGRIVLANISFNSTKVSLRNIYAPNKLDLQLRFISTLNGIQHRYRINCNFLTYFQVISAIPSALRKKAKERAKPNVNFLSGGILFQLTPVLTIDLLKLRSKDYY